MKQLFSLLTILLLISCSPKANSEIETLKGSVGQEVEKPIVTESIANKNEGSSSYIESMINNINQIEKCKTMEDYNLLCNKFIRIAKAEKSKWLPYYYATQCKIFMSFEEKSDRLKKDSYLDEAKVWFDKMINLAPEESEIYSLEAMYYSARLVVDPMNRGQEYSLKSNTSAKKALMLNKNNNRAKFMLIQNQIGFKSFFGNDISSECSQAKGLYDSWEKHESENQLSPKWGKKSVKEIIDNCDKDK